MAVVTSNNQAVVLAAAGCFTCYVRKKFGRKRRIWVKRYREEFSHTPLVLELRENYPDDFRNYLRMDGPTFDLLLNLLKEKIAKKDTVMRASISAEQRLVATLRYLATGRSYEDLKFTTGISVSLLSAVIPETCRALYEVLRGEYLKFPTAKDEWKATGKGFEDRWQFVNCGGAIDGKHIRIVPPPNSGAYFYNYKNYYSIVLMALVNWNYEFIFIDVGKNGRVSDGGVIEHTHFYERLNSKQLHLPENNENVNNLNFVFLGDEAFALKENLLKPYPQQDLDHDKRIFNYRLSRGRNVVENTFGIITSRFRVLHTPINMKVASISYVVCAICVLHNFLRRRSSGYITPESLDTGNLSDITFHDIIELHTLQSAPPRNSANSAKENRDRFKEYFCNEGSVPWQEEILKAGRA